MKSLFFIILFTAFGSPAFAQEDLTKYKIVDATVCSKTLSHRSEHAAILWLACFKEAVLETFGKYPETWQYEEKFLILEITKKGKWQVRWNTRSIAENIKAIDFVLNKKTELSTLGGK